MKFLTVLLLCLLPSCAFAKPLELKGNFTQGGLVLGKSEPGATITLDETPVSVAEDGRFVFGFGRDFKETAVLKIRFPDGTEEMHPLKIAPRKWRIENISGLPPSKVTPSEKFLKRIREENGEIARIRAINTPKEWYLSGWRQPVEGRFSGFFGSQRILNGVPKRPHFGLDIAGAVGTPVVASTDGMVRMAAKDLFYTGGTIMIDHGFGLVSVYSHLSKLDVKPGQFVHQGEKIGEVGMTGRASGPHLDWRVNWLKERLDPELLLGKDLQN
ncbi:MAG: M23 family metallopeptidase [Alphaproteobacteria bacterium]|nr:MAG: M23 family metallopeptidase [Alphaproteobacteria bacterium]